MKIIKFTLIYFGMVMLLSQSSVDGTTVKFPIPHRDTVVVKASTIISDTASKLLDSVKLYHKVTDSTNTDLETKYQILVKQQKVINDQLISLEDKGQ